MYYRDNGRIQIPEIKISARIKLFFVSCLPWLHCLTYDGKTQILFSSVSPKSWYNGRRFRFHGLSTGTKGFREKRKENDIKGREYRALVYVIESL